jgi:protoporphyrinogen oxidase
MIDRFYKPFFSGIFLENDLTTSSNMFDFVMKMFSEGDAALPELGMEEIPKQLIAMLPKDSIQYNIKVNAIENNKIICENGKIVETETIIIATEAIGLASNYIPKNKQDFHQVTNVYFEAKIPPTQKAVVVLNAAANKKWASNLTVLTNVSKKYSSDERVLISVSLNGNPTVDDETLAKNMQLELKNWYGNQVNDWKIIKVYRINYALPNQKKVTNEVLNSELELDKNVFICGDHLMNGSINAAMKSGRLVAELIDSLN